MYTPDPAYVTVSANTCPGTSPLSSIALPLMLYNVFIPMLIKSIGIVTLMPPPQLLMTFDSIVEDPREVVATPQLGVFEMIFFRMLADRLVAASAPPFMSSNIHCLT